MTVYCPACRGTFGSFLPGPGGRPRARCPRCQSLERHRLLIKLFREHQFLFMRPARVLDLAPNQAVRRYLEPRLGSGYVSADKFMERGVSVRADLTGLGFASDSFDAVVCYHVLEHIPEDHLAIAEIGRMLKPGGIAFIQVPRRAGPTDEDPTAPVDERVRRFGQDDHVRYYGDDFEDRLRKGGLIPQTLRPARSLPEAEVRRMGLVRDEEVWVCRVADWSRAPEVVTPPPPEPPPAGRADLLLMRARRIAGRTLRALGLRKLKR